MPLKPRITCRYPSCQRIAVQGGYCEKHQNTKPQYGYQKDKKRHALYNRRWQKESKKFLADHPWCDDCMAKGVSTVATEVHHKKKHEGNYDLFWDRSNWSGLCHKCHSKRTARGE